MYLPRALLFAAAALSLHAAPTLTDLGTLGGPYSSLPYGGGMGSGSNSAASYSGSVLAGYSSLAGNNANHAFIYSGGLMTDLGTLGGNHSNAYGISANGSVVIGSSSLAGDTASHAFIYSGGVMTDLGTLGGTYSNASGISANGSVVIGSSSLAGDTASHAFIYSGGVMTDLGTLGGTYSSTNGISANGSVVIGSSNLAGNNASHAFIYSGGVMTDINPLLVSAFGTITGSQLFGLSDDGLVAAGYYQTASVLGGFYYRNGVVTDMGNLGGTFGYAAGVSGDGSLVFGNSNLANGNGHAVTLSLGPVAPTTISTTITASDTRVTGGNALQFQGGTLAPVGAVTLNLASGIQILTSSTGTLDATSQDISSTGAVTIDGTSLTLAGSPTSVISLSGAISGAGILINAVGNNIISGANTSAGISVTGGSLRIASAASLPATNNSVSTGGTLIIATNLNAAGAISVAGNGAAGQAGALVFETAVNSVNDTVITLTNDATLAVAGSHEIRVRGAINATTAGKKLTVDTGAGFFLLDGGIGTNITQVEVKGTGDLLLRSNTSANYTVNAGATLVAESVAHFGVGAVVAAGGALRLGVGAGINQNFTQSVTISGTGAGSGAALELGWYNNDTLSGALTLAADATVLSHTANNVISGAITGATSGQKLTLVVDDLSLKLTGTTASSVAQVTKTGAGVLLIDTIGVINSGTVVVTTGLLANNGLINGVVTVASTGTLGGSGTIAGTVTVAGTLAPGNSPGLLTQTTGDLNLTTGSHFLAELGGTTAGNGNGFHDQYFVSNGAINIANGVTLDVKSWLAADGITTFAPVRTNVFSVLKASNGIAGVFSDFTNADYSQWLLFDNSQLIHSPGNLYGTGLNGNQTFAAYGTTAARAAVGASLWAAAVTPSTSSTTANPAGFIYAGSSSGAAAIGLLTAVDADAYLAALSPEAYLAAGDYALTISRSVTEAAFGQTSLLKTGSWTLGAGYNRAQHGYRGADAASNYELSGNTSLVTLTRDFGPHCSVGFFFGYNTGKTVANNANLDYRGNVFGLTSVGRYEGKHPVTLKAAVVASDIRFDAVRNGSTANDQTIRALSGQLTASLELYKEGRLTFSPLLGFVQGRSTSDAFAEAGAGARLNVNALERKSARGLAGLGATYILSNDLQLDVAFAYEYEFADAPTGVTASFVDAAATVPMTIEHALVDRSTTSGTLGANWKIDNSITLRLSAEARGNRELHKDYRYNVGLNVRF